MQVQKKTNVEHSLNPLVFFQQKTRLSSKFFPRKSGFSLVELMVSISIFVLITSMTLANYPKFSNKLSLDLLAEDIALSIRQAQIFGSSIFGIKVGNGGSQTKKFGSYGVHFEAPDGKSRPGNSVQYLYLLFADIAPGKPEQYDGTSSSDPNTEGLPCLGPAPSQECLQKFLVTGRNKVKFLCANFEEGDTDKRVKSCDSPNKKLSVLDVVFVRPNLDANFFAKDENSMEKSGLSNVGIVLESPGGEYYKTIVIWRTGQISVE